MNKKIVVLFHRADFDGIFCREIARKFLPQAELIGWDYGDPVPDPTVVSSEDQLYMLDISIDGLMGHPRLVWIDHHKSAIEKYPATIPGYRIDGVAACRLAWQYFGGVNSWNGQIIPTKQDFVDRKVSEPWAVRLAGEYDIWDKRDPRAELFQCGLRSMDLTNHWGSLLGEFKPDIKALEEMIACGMSHDILEPDGTAIPPIVHTLLEKGKVVEYVKRIENEQIITSAGFNLDWEGLRFLACNHARYNSFLFTAETKPEHDALLGFAWRGGKWTVSLYHAPGKEHHDLSLLAVKHGGGGHRGACGFTCATLPFELTNRPA
jgi:oligoribonuclease NrnB/cAMP/cGMP phosphodiesterase (DHH superfamily)